MDKKNIIDLNLECSIWFSTRSFLIYLKRSINEKYLGVVNSRKKMIVETGTQL
jgi:hypothetical protein